MSNHYKHITLSGVQYIQAVNPFDIKVGLTSHLSDKFDKANPPIIWYGPAFEGTISEEDIEKFWQYHHRETDTWLELDPEYYEDIEGNRFRSFGEDVTVRQCGRLKEQPDKAKQIISDIMQEDEKDGLQGEAEERDVEELKAKVVNLNTHSRQVFANWIINNSKSF